MLQLHGCLVSCCYTLFVVLQASKARDAEMMQLHKASADTSAKLQKALESLTTAQASGDAWDQAITSHGLWSLICALLATLNVYGSQGIAR